MKAALTVSAQQRQTRWRELVGRQAVSGRSVAAFCRDESIAVQTFYWWRARLGKCEARPSARAIAAPFVELGTVAGLGGAAPGAELAVRLDLPGGITLTIARR